MKKTCPFQLGCRNKGEPALSIIKGEPVNSDYAIVLDRPYGVGSLLSDKLEHVFFPFLKEIGIDSYYLTSLSKCKKDPTNTCLSMLVDELKIVKPKKMLVLGANAASIMGIKGAVSDNRIKFNTFMVKDLYTDIAIPTIVTATIDFIYDRKGSIIFNSLRLLKNAMEYTPEYDIIQDPDRVHTALKDVSRWSLDFEAPPPEYKPYSMAISTEERNFYVEFSNIPIKNFSKLFMLQNNKVIHSQYELKILKDVNIPYDMHFSDTWLYSYIIDPNRDSYSLKHLAADYFMQPDYSVDFNTYTQLTMEQRAHYNVLDSFLDLKLFNLFQTIGDERARRLFKYIVNPFLHVLSDMNYYGVNIDDDTLKSIINNLYNKTKVLKEELSRIKSIPKDLNLDSPKQLAELVYDRWKLKAYQFTKKKEPSTSQEALRQLAAIYKRREKVLIALAEHSALSGAYDLLKQFESIKQGNKLYSKYWPHNTATGRLSSEKPNMQNIPPEYRHFIVPERGMFFDVDVSQADIRMLAQESGDKELIKKLEGDIHTGIASIRYEKPENEITSEERKDSKRITFGIVYGITEYGLSKNLNISIEEAGVIKKRLMTQLGGVAEYWDYIKKFLYKNLYVQNMYGRRRYFTKQQLAIDRESVLRQALNAPIQSDTNDTIFLISSIIKFLLNRHKKYNTVNIQIHDEIVMNVEEPIDGVFGEATTIFVDTLSKFGIILKLPILLEFGYGSRFGQIHKSKIWTILPNGGYTIVDKDTKKQL